MARPRLTTVGCDRAYSSKESDRRDSDADQRVLSGHVPRVATDFHVQLYPEHHFVDND
jgi:hypothetical protein